MHGTEHCNRDRRTLRLSAPRKPVFGRKPDQRFDARRKPLPDRSPKLVTAFRSPATATASRGLHSGVNVPGLLLRLATCRFRSPFGSSAPHPPPVRPAEGCFLASSPLPLPRPARLAAPPASTPRRDFYLPSDQSVLQVRLPAGSPSELARSPFAPRSRFLLLVFRLRITVPGPLRFRRLAVPQTSWNHPQYAPDRPFRSMVFVSFSAVFLRIFPTYFYRVTDR